MMPLHLRKFKIVGLFKTGLNMLDDVIFQIPFSDAQKILRMGDATQQIIIMLKDYRKSDLIAARIERRWEMPRLQLHHGPRLETGTA
ncbi:MAG: hypothetical protein ABIA63_03370 [bacterium]